MYNYKGPLQNGHTGKHVNYNLMKGSNSVYIIEYFSQEISCFHHLEKDTHHTHRLSSI